MADPDEALPPEVWMIATLKEMVEAQKMTNKQLQGMQSELEAIRRNQANNTVHLKYEVNLSVVHTNHELADFVKMGIEMNAIVIMPVPSALSLRLRGLTDELIDLDAKESFDLSGHSITRLLVTNEAGTGTAEIHVFGR